jgi:hypothetical protein
MGVHVIVRTRPRSSASVLQATYIPDSLPTVSYPSPSQLGAVTAIDWLCLYSAWKDAVHPADACGSHPAATVISHESVHLE